MSDGTFVWYELMSTNTQASAAFFSELFGWTTQTMDMGPGGQYTMLANGESAFGGLQAQQMQGAPSCWVGYIQVPDVAQSVEKVQRMGGNTLVPTTEIPNTGTFAIVTDPQGAAFALWKSGSEGSGARHTETGDFGWAELGTTDLQAAKGFYGENFGWKTISEMETDTGPYVMFGHGETPLGGMITKPDPAPMSYWAHYVNVEDVQATVDRTLALGGKNYHGPVHIPGMVTFAILGDPTGAMFGVAHSERE